MTAPDLLVLRQGIHGMSSERYADALRDRLPGYDVIHARTRTEELSKIADVPTVTGVMIDEELVDRANQLSIFACVYAGTDHLPMDLLTERGVTVTNASGVHGPNVSEFAIGSILSLVHNFDVGRRRQDRQVWRHYQTGELYGDTVTIVGMGAIGQAIAERLDGFGVDTIGVRYTPSKGGPTDEVIGFDDRDFEDALSRTDHLILACPLTDETRGLIGRAELVTLSPSATLVNVARGEVVHTEALVWALREDRLHGVSLDVTDPEPLPSDHPLWTFENAMITPHNSGSTPRYYDRVANIVAENFDRAEEGESLKNVVR
ncbi:MAG: NAD(P)-dependent oxidoreductase [Natronomonas sp.]